MGEVYWTSTGLRYHKSYDYETRTGHIYTASHKTFGTESEAVEFGLTPCQHCFPDREVRIIVSQSLTPVN